jgi:hypothetical protein
MGVKVIDVIYDSRLRSIAQPDFSQRWTNKLIEETSRYSKELWSILLSDESWSKVHSRVA